MEPLAALHRPTGILAGRGHRYACAHCAVGGTHERTKVLQLLALLEHPKALPPELALGVAAQLLRLMRPLRAFFRSDD